MPGFVAVFGRGFVLLGLLSGFLILPPLAGASEFFVRDTIGDRSTENLQATTALVRNAVASRSRDQIAADELKADFVLQPRLIRVGRAWILTVEKLRSRGGEEETLFAAQTKLVNLTQMDRAVRAATGAAIEEPSLPGRSTSQMANEESEPSAPYRSTDLDSLAAAEAVQPAPEEATASASGQTRASSEETVAPAPKSARVSAPIIDVLPPTRKVNYWSLGVGPSIARNLSDDPVLYDVMIGHLWDLDSNVTVKAMGEGHLSSGKNGSRFYDLAIGMNYYLPVQSVESGPYGTVDVGYGYASNGDGGSARGASVGLGAGYQFFRDTEVTLDLLLRYAVIFDDVEGPGGRGRPSVAGARLAVNF